MAKMTKEERLYYDRGYRAGQKKAKKEAFDKGWKSAHDEFEDYLKKEHYDKGYAAGRQDNESTYNEAYSKGHEEGKKEGRQEADDDWGPYLKMQKEDIIKEYMESQKFKNIIALAKTEVVDKFVADEEKVKKKAYDKGYKKGDEDARADVVKNWSMKLDEKHEKDLVEEYNKGFTAGEAKGLEMLDKSEKDAYKAGLGEGKQQGYKEAKLDFKADAKAISDNLEKVKRNAYESGKKDAMKDAAGILKAEENLKEVLAQERENHDKNIEEWRMKEKQMIASHHAEFNKMNKIWAFIAVGSLAAGVVAGLVLT